MINLNKVREQIISKTDYSIKEILNIIKKCFNAKVISENSVININQRIFLTYKEDENAKNEIVLQSNVKGYDYSLFELFYELKYVFFKYGYKIIVQKESNNLIDFSLKKYDIIIDGNKQILLLNGEKENLNIYSNEVKALKAVAHYTCIDAAISILQNKCFFSIPLNPKKHELKFSNGINASRLCFITSFCELDNNNSHMWERYANNYKGCKLSFYFKKSFFDGFKTQENIKGEYNDGREEFFRVNEETNNNIIKDINKDIIIRKVFLRPQLEEYGDKIGMSITTDTGLDDYIILDHVANSIIKKMEKLKEIRIALILSSFKEVECGIIEKLYLPFNMNAIEKIEVEFGSNTSDFDKKRMIDLINNKNKIIFK